MAEATQAPQENVTSPATKTIKGKVFTVETVELAPAKDGEASREMGVLWIEDEDKEPVRITDFSSMHKLLEEDANVRAVYSEHLDTRDPARHELRRNLVSIKLV